MSQDLRVYFEAQKAVPSSCFLTSNTSITFALKVGGGGL